MSASVFALVILAALLHASWNALVKGGTDKSAGMVAVVYGQGLFGLCCLPFVAVPSLVSVPWLVAGVLLHLGYQIFLVAAYRLGDMTRVYPIARGAAPVLVTLFSIVVLGVSFNMPQLAAVGLIAIGLVGIATARGGDGVFQGRALVFALVTGGFIAAYSLVDGIGARLAGTALGFYAWLGVSNALLLLVLAQLARPGLSRRALAQTGTLVLGGGASFVAFSLVIYAFTQAPIALVTALRETSIVFALLIGVTLLKEPLSPVKLLATACIIAGAALLGVYS